MKTSDFYYDLPQELIAQDPLEDRSSSRLLVLDRKAGERELRSQQIITFPSRANNINSNYVQGLNCFNLVVYETETWK